MPPKLPPVAWIAFGTHAAAALGSLLVLQHGSPVGPDPGAREAYVATHLGLWRVGWLFWTLASLSLVALLFALDRRAAWLSVAALPFDITSQLLLAIPAWPHERLAYLGTGLLANGIYTAAFTWAILRATIPRWLAWAALPAIAGGVAVSLASWTLQPTFLYASMALLTAGMIGWLGLLGVWTWRASL